LGKGEARDTSSIGHRPMPMMPMAYDNCTVQFAYRTIALNDMRRQTLGMGAA
jgi:hypothetical protein